MKGAITVEYARERAICRLWPNSKHLREIARDLPQFADRAHIYAALLRRGREESPRDLFSREICLVERCHTALERAGQVLASLWPEAGALSPETAAAFVRERRDLWIAIADCLAADPELGPASLQELQPVAQRYRSDLARLLVLRELAWVLWPSESDHDRAARRVLALGRVLPQPTSVEGRQVCLTTSSPLGTGRDAVADLYDRVEERLRLDESTRLTPRDCEYIRHLMDVAKGYSELDEGGEFFDA